MNTDMKKQTAVEYLIEEMQKRIPPYYSHYVMQMDKVYDQAKAMERNQIIDAYNAARNDHHQMYFAEEYYNETYGNNK